MKSHPKIRTKLLLPVAGADMCLTARLSCQSAEDCRAEIAGCGKGSFNHPSGLTDNRCADRVSTGLTGGKGDNITRGSLWTLGDVSHSRPSTDS